MMTIKHYFNSSFLKIIILPDGIPGGLTAGGWPEKNKIMITYFKDLHLRYWNQYYSLLLSKERYCLLVNRSLYPNTENLKFQYKLSFGQIYKSTTIHSSNLAITFEHWHHRKMPKIETILMAAS